MNTLMNLNENELAAVVGGADAEFDIQNVAKPAEIVGSGREAGYQVGLDLGVTGIDWHEATNYYGPVTPVSSIPSDERAWTRNAPVQLGIAGR